MMKTQPIPGFEGSYIVSDDGDVIYVRDGVYRIRRLRKTNKGYLYVNLKLEGRAIHISVHRTVALLFVPNPLNLPTVNHEDGNKENNNATNLVWSSHADNNLHAIRTGLRPSMKGRVYRRKFGSSDSRFHAAV